MREESAAFAEKSCHDFIGLLASKSAVPGGGGACALCGAIGMALGNMVVSLTLGKQKYANVREEMEIVQSSATRLQKRLLSLIDEDAEGFEPLSKAYSLPKDSPESRSVMESALNDACRAPLAIMEACAESIALIEIIAKKGTVIALSDAGAGMQLCLAAMKGASLNVFINTRYMKDQSAALEWENKANALIEKYSERAQAVIDSVTAKLTGSL